MDTGPFKVRMAFVDVRFALAMRRFKRACVEASRAFDKLSTAIKETNERTTV